MYRIEIENNGVTEILHESDPKSFRRVKAGEFTEDVHSTDTATISVSPQNPAYAHLHELTTLIRFINTKTEEVEFDGRIFHIPEESMDSSSIITKKILCEGTLGYLCDTVQLYHHYEDTEVTGFLASLLDYHNSVMQTDSPERCILLGAVTFHNTNSKTTAQRTTMEEIKENLTSRLGGILRTRRNAQNQILLDYYQESDYGQICDTAVEIAVNMKSISSGTDATGVITRLYPFGCQLNSETGERLTIASVNDNCPYIDDQNAIAKYGIKCGSIVFDDITVPENLLAKGREYLSQACVIKKNFQAVVLDLSTIGKAADSFRAGNTYRFVNRLLGLDEYLRVIKRTVNIFQPYQPVIEIGDKIEKITDIATQTRKYVEYEIPKQKSEILQQAQNNATALITSATHGYVVVEPEEILIMNTNSKDTATKLWRWNINGLGYSKNDTPGRAYDGPYGTAITMDGAIVADYITAGTMTADRIYGGTLTVGGQDNVNGIIAVKNASGDTICLFNSSGASINGEIKAKNNSGYWVKVTDGKISAGGTESGQEREYVVMDGTGSIIDATVNPPRTRKGLRISADAVFIDSTLLAVKAQGEPDGSYHAGFSGTKNLIIDDIYVSNIDVHKENINGIDVITDINSITISWDTKPLTFKNGILSR